MINITEVFASHDDEFLKFDSVQADSKLSNRPDLCAFLLLDRLVQGADDIVSNAEHDEIFLDVDVEALAHVATSDDILTLVRCGVRLDKETESLAMFV